MIKRSILACLAGLFTWFVVVIAINWGASPDLAELHRCRTDAPVHAGHEVGTPCDGHCHLTGRRRHNRLDISIEPLGAVDCRRRGACNVCACAHRNLEQISGVVSPDVSPDDYSGGARGCAAAIASEQRPQRGLPRAEMKLHRCAQMTAQYLLNVPQVSQKLPALRFRKTDNGSGF